MELKGVEKVNQVVEDFVAQFGCGAIMGDEFGYLYGRSIVEWSLLIGREVDEFFYSFVTKEFPDAFTNLFVWSLLHEVGHHETIDMWSKEEQKEFDSIKEELDKRYQEEDSREACFEYFNLPDEYEATRWAAEYIQSHELELIDFTKKMRAAVKNFYEENEIPYWDSFGA